MKGKSNDESYKMAYTKAVRTGILDLRQKEIIKLPIGIFTLHEFVPDENGWWELLVPHTLLLAHNEISDLSAPKGQNWIDAWKEMQTLNISYNQIKQIPNQILKMECLRNLIFHHNRLSQLSFGGILSHNLIHIELQHNDLLCLDENIGSCVNLETLNISHNKINSLPQSLSQCIKLQKIEATNNKIYGDLSSLKLSKCPNLKEIDLSFNAITAVHCSMFYLPSLHRLALRQNKISQICFDDEYEHKEQRKSQLIDLYIGQNNLSYFPFDKFDFPFLKMLDLNANNFDKISKDISKCSKLQRLDISNNNLNDIPAEIALIDNIKHILVSGNPLRRINRSVISDSHLLIKYLQKRLAPINDDIDHLNDAMNKMNIANINEKELKLNQQKLCSLPSGLCKMTNLCHLELDDNELSDLSDLKYCINLEHLSAKKNKISDISPLFVLNNLTEIDLRINKIQKININHQESNEIWPKLHTLRLGYNQIDNVTDLCACICSTNVTILDFGNNQITQFPQCVLQWTLLEVLDFSNNDLTKVPFELGLMQRLNALMLSGNRLRRIQSLINNAGSTQKLLESLKARISLS